MTLTDVSLRKFRVYASWKTGRVILSPWLVVNSFTKLQAVTFAIPNYTMQSMKLPEAICSRLDKFLLWHDEEKEENSYI